MDKNQIDDIKDMLGTLVDEYNTYLACADDGNGMDITTGKPLLTFDEWLNS